MDFKVATDRLTDRVSHEELAETLGVSVAAIRQARLSPEANAHRQPPPGWEKGVAQLARARSSELAVLADVLETGDPGFEKAMAAFERSRRKFRNALRELND